MRVLPNESVPFSSTGGALLVLSVCVLLTLGGPLGTIPSAHAQSSDPGGSALNLTVGTVGVSVGDSRRTTGLRLNYRDRRLERAVGLNLTLWRPHDEVSSVVSGLALGLPLTGADRLRGLGLGVGLSAQSTLSGVALGLAGVGSGERLSGVAVGGLGVGAGGALSGVAIGGLGVGAGEGASGLVVGGLGAGAGDDAAGIILGGLGAGAGGDATGTFLAAGGAGAGESARGLLLGGLGAGAGEDVRGVLVGGIGAGAGERLSGVGIGGVGLGGGESMSGLFLAGGGIGSPRIAGLSVAGGFVRVEGGSLRGVSVSAYNDVRAPQRGLTIGLYNYTRELHGLQLGLLNVARNNPAWARILPVVNLNL